MKKSNLFYKVNRLMIFSFLYYSTSSFFFSYFKAHNSVKIKRWSELRDFQVYPVMSASIMILFLLILQCFVSLGQVRFVLLEEGYCLYSMKNVTLEMKQSHLFSEVYGSSSFLLFFNSGV